MKTYLAAAAVLCASANLASASLLIYEPFDYTPGTIMLPGDITTDIGNGAGIGLVNTSGPNAPLNWYQAGTAAAGTTRHQIASSGLTGPAGFPASIGNAAIMEGGASGRSDFKEMARMNLPGGPYLPGADPLYYSVLLNVSDLTGLTTANTNANANNDLIIGFNNGGYQTAPTPNTWAGELVIRLGSDSSHFNLGIRASTTVANTTYWSGDLNPNSTYLIVARWTEGATAGTGGLSELWINPDSSTFGTGVAPTPNGSTVGTFSATGTNDHTNSLLIGAGIGAGTNPNEVRLDEIRVGTTWADVTAVPEPASLSVVGLAATGLLARRRRA